METRQVARIPEGDDWSYEPKWDGFRCIAFRDGDDVELQSKSGESLTRYFPEIVTALKKAGAREFVTDGELLVADETGSDFDALLQRIHPAESRVRRLAQETPASYVLFDLARGGPQRVLRARAARSTRPIGTLRAAKFRSRSHDSALARNADVELARRWLAGESGAPRRHHRQEERSLCVRKPRRGRQDQAQLHRRLRRRRISLRAEERSRRCCSACTMTTADSITSASSAR